MNFERFHLRMPDAPLCCVLRWLAFLSLTVAAGASTIAGTVINRTTGLPSAGDEVAVYRVDRSMHLEGRTKSDARGEFRFALPDHVRCLVAASHAGVLYHTSVLAGEDPVEVPVYDVANSPENVNEQSDTSFLEEDHRSLKVTEFFVLSNPSNRTVAGANTFDFALPRRAILDSVAVEAPNTLPVQAAADRGPENRYGIHKAIHPGITKVRAVYHLPYPGHALFTSTPLRPVSTMAVMVPKSMVIASEIPGRFTYRGEQNHLAMYVASNVHSGRPVAFTISGIESVTTDVSQMIALARRDRLPSDLRIRSGGAGQVAGSPAAKPGGALLTGSLTWRLLLAVSGACAAALAGWKFRCSLSHETLSRN